MDGELAVPETAAPALKLVPLLKFKLVDADWNDPPGIDEGVESTDHLTPFAPPVNVHPVSDGSKFV
jgi:hypothetical protein